MADTALFYINRFHEWARRQCGETAEACKRLRVTAEEFLDRLRSVPHEMVPQEATTPALPPPGAEPLSSEPENDKATVYLKPKRKPSPAVLPQSPRGPPPEAARRAGALVSQAIVSDVEELPFNNHRRDARLRPLTR